VVNSTTYRARPTALFRDFSERWKSMVIVHHDKSTQASERSEIKAWVSRIGGMQMKDITSEHVQETITHWSSPGKDGRSAARLRQPRERPRTHPARTAQANRR